MARQAAWVIFPVSLEWKHMQFTVDNGMLWNVIFFYEEYVNSASAVILRLQSTARLTFMLWRDAQTFTGVQTDSAWKKQPTEKTTWDSRAINEEFASGWRGRSPSSATRWQNESRMMCTSCHVHKQSCLTLWEAWSSPGALVGQLQCWWGRVLQGWHGVCGKGGVGRACTSFPLLWGRVGSDNMELQPRSY